jgi:hypothetical protein
MKVYMRREEEARGDLVGDLPLAGIDGYVEELFRWIKRAGGAYDGDGLRGDCTYQLVCDETGAYVEVIFHADEE